MFFNISYVVVLIVINLLITYINMIMLTVTVSIACIEKIFASDYLYIYMITSDFPPVK